LLTNLETVLRVVARALIILALCCAIGLQWVALQSIAWTTMLVQHSKQQSLGIAIAQTFDGSHPCSLCHFVSNGKSSEKKSDLQQIFSKIDMLCAPRAISLLRPFVRFDYSLASFSLSIRNHSPPVPPPRSLA
jgi:hypothetical protein